MELPSFVGRYEIRGEIAEGGFALVVEAWDEDLSSVVALKIMHADLARDDDLLQRFLSEARLMRRVRSPNVLTVHDVGRLDDGRPYFVMDYADRGTLADRLHDRSDAAGPDLISLSTIIDSVANGLGAIHDAGLVHRDIKPENVLLQLARRAPVDDDATVIARPALIAADERVLVGDLGIAKDLIRPESEFTLLGGTPYYQAPEQTDEDARVTKAADIYAATALLWNVLTNTRPPQPHEVAESVQSLPPLWAQVVARGMAVDPANRFPDAEAWRAAAQGALGREIAPARGRATTPAAPSMSSTAVCPYKGLEAFQPEDAGKFFGREALVDELLRRLRLQRVLVVGGPSGSGKSSLVRAGLIPALLAGALPSSESWNIVLFTPGRDPLAEMHFHVTRALPADTRTVPLGDLLVRPTLARHLATADTSGPALLVIDQFEEVFTLAAPEQRDAFVTALSAMTDPADSEIRVVIAVRADFYAACAQLPWLAERITENQVLVGPMSDAELKLAISEPARRAGLFLEKSLIDEIVEHATGEAGTLPLVSHAMVETWRRRQGNVLTLEAFKEAGGVAGAISQTADTIFDTRFNPAEQASTKQLFLRLVNPGEGTPDTRRSMPLADIKDDETAHRVIAALTEARLLTVDEAQVQIAHEALLRSWPRLRHWIEESRDDLRARQRIGLAAAEWAAQNRDPDLLYRGTRLTAAQEWHEHHPDGLGALEREFLAAALSARSTQEQAEATRRTRTRRVRRGVLAGLSVLALGTTAASVVAFVGFQNASRNEQLAIEKTAEAQQRFAGALGTAAHSLVDKDPLLALALATESIARTAGPPQFEARAAMVAARQVLSRGDPYLVGSPIPAGDALGIALSPDANTIAIGRRNGDIELVDLATREALGPVLRGHEGGVEDVAFAPDGRSIASASDDGTVRLWSASGNDNDPRIVGSAGNVLWNVRFDTSNNTLVTAGYDAVHLWPLLGGSNSELPAPGLGDFLSLALSTDGNAVLAGNGDGEVLGWHLPDGSPLFTAPLQPHTSDVWGLEFSPTGKRFATVSSDGTSKILDFPSGKVVGTAFGGSKDIVSVAFAPNGQLIGGDTQGALRLWDVDRSVAVGTTPAGHSQPVIDVKVSRDGNAVVSLGRDQLIRHWQFNTFNPLALVHQVAGHAAKGLAIDNATGTLAAGDDSGTIQLWRPGQKQPQLLSGHADQIWALGFSPDGKLLASADRSGEIRLWAMPSGMLQNTIAGDGTPVWSIMVAADAVIVASDKAVRLLDPTSGETRAAWTVPTGTITRAAAAPDGGTIAVAGSDGKVRLLQASDLTVRREVPVDDDVVWSVAFSRDGSLLATGTGDEVVTVWDLLTGTRRGDFTGHAGGVTDITFLADGVTLAALDRRGELHLWDIASGRRLAAPLTAHGTTAWRIVADPNDDGFATAGDDGLVKSWNLFSTEAACIVSAVAFDAPHRHEFLGDNEQAVGCATAKP